MTFNHFNRRLHLYLGMTLLPWFFMYGISSYVFNHPREFEERFKASGVPLWTKRFERTYDVAVPAGDDLKALGARIMKDAGLDGSFGTYRQNENQINVYAHTFWWSTQVKYFINEKKLVAEDRAFRWDHFLTGMHARGGFDQDSVLSDAWAVVIDIVCLGMLLWIASGLYMWWKISVVRGWGWLALLSGLTTFGLFLWRL